MEKKVLQERLKEQREIIKAETDAEYKLCQELLKIEIEENKNNIGRCFKYRNNYSCPEKDDDYWFLYLKIIGVEDKRGDYECIEFQKDSYGICQICITTKYSNFINDYVEISETEWKVAMLNHLNIVQEMLYSIK